MSTWMVIVGIWVLFAICVVLFVRGASVSAHQIDETHDDGVVVPSHAETSRIKI
jgi:hypothetical protein